MEFLNSLLAITLFGSIFWGLATVSLFLFICFYADVIEEGFVATIALVLFGILFYFFGKDSWHAFLNILTWQFLSLYFGLGLIHAFIRVYFHGRKEMMKVNEDRIEGSSYEHKIDRDIKGHVFRWWFLWPVSLINWFIKDMIRDIYNWVYGKLSRVFDYIMDLGVKSVPAVPKKEAPERKR